MLANPFTPIAILALLLNMAHAGFAFAEAPQVDPALPISHACTHAPDPLYSLQTRTLLPLPETTLLTFADATAPRVNHREAEAGSFSLVQPGEGCSEPKAREPLPCWEPAGASAAGTSWPWRRAQGADYAAVSIAAAGAIFFEHENGKPVEPAWTAHNGFDESVRDLLRLESRSARAATHDASNVLMGIMIAAPVIDSLATLGIRDARWDALWQISMINMESFAFTSLVSSLMQNLIRRERPFVRNCQTDDCEGDLENRSMPSGHVAFAFTGAGLLCNHHKYQSLYGDPAADRAACATGIGLAALDGVLRIASDRHYATDVAVGTALGLFSGFVLPRLLHYSRSPQAGENPEGRERSVIKRLLVTPQLLSGGAGVNCDFRF